MKAVILAAGIGTRMEPLTLGRSKGMVPVANKPVLEWVASLFREAVIVARKDQSDIIEYFKGHEIVFQKEPKGTANALLAAKGSIDGDFIMVNGDDLFSKEDVEKFLKSKSCAVAVAKHKTPEKFGTVDIGDGKVKEIKEKQDSPESNLVNCGLYRFSQDIFNYIEKTPLSGRGEYEITDAINIAIKDGMHFDAIEVSGWQTVSHPWDVLDANQKILEENWSMISGSAKILPGAHIEEPVAIGSNAVIGPNCYIRKYSSIGNGCKIGNAVEIKNSIVMDNSHVSHLSYVGDSIIGRNCNVGAGTIFANLRLDEKEISADVKGNKIITGRRKLGGVVGDNAKLGINVSVMPGVKIWPGMMVPPCFLVKKDVREQPDLRL